MIIKMYKLKYAVLYFSRYLIFDLFYVY